MPLPYVQSKILSVIDCLKVSLYFTLEVLNSISCRSFLCFWNYNITEFSALQFQTLNWKAWIIISTMGISLQASFAFFQIIRPFSNKPRKYFCDLYFWCERASLSLIWIQKDIRLNCRWPSIFIAIWVCLMRLTLDSGYCVSNFHIINGEKSFYPINFRNVLKLC